MVFSVVLSFEMGGALAYTVFYPNFLNIFPLSFHAPPVPRPRALRGMSAPLPEEPEPPDAASSSPASPPQPPPEGDVGAIIRPNPPNINSPVSYSSQDSSDSLGWVLYPGEFIFVRKCNFWQFFFAKSNLFFFGASTRNHTQIHRIF